MKQLSIVIAAYNSQDYLRKCLDSLVIPSDKMELAEVIVVNDGSKDDTLAIAQEYHTKYPDYFIVIDKGNGNYGSCMNAALKIVRGKYFRVLDSDDWFITENYIKFLDELQETDADVITCEKMQYYAAHDLTDPRKFVQGVPFHQDLPACEETWKTGILKVNFSTHVFTFKTQVLRDSSVVWDEGVFYTDHETIHWAFKHAKSIRAIPMPVYVYYIGREDQSVGGGNMLASGVIKKNWKSVDTVVNRIVDDTLKEYDPQSPTATPLYIDLKNVLKMMVRSVVYNEKKYNDAVTALVEKLKTNPELYQRLLNDMTIYKKIPILKGFVNNDWRLKLCRFLFKQELGNTWLWKLILLAQGQNPNTLIRM